MKYTKENEKEYYDQKLINDTFKDEKKSRIRLTGQSIYYRFWVCL